MADPALAPAAPKRVALAPFAIVVGPFAQALARRHGFGTAGTALIVGGAVAIAAVILLLVPVRRPLHPVTVVVAAIVGAIAASIAASAISAAT
jgi:hypothetical protein